MTSWHPDADMKDKIKHECRMISDLLCKKNESYGDSACSPIQIFSKLDANDAICARIDDKLSRIANRGINGCLLYTSPSPRDGLLSRMPSSA